MHISQVGQVLPRIARTFLVKPGYHFVESAHWQHSRSQLTLHLGYKRK